MSRRWLPGVIAANLVALLTLAVAFPQLMISPGRLIPEHAALEKDCFACHALWRGAASERCLKCHKLEDIGLRTTQGAPVPPRKVKTSFHRQLVEQACVACHSDHAGPKLAQRPGRRFSHSLLQPGVREGCGACHGAPSEGFHRDLTAACSRCHNADAWKPASFEHSLLSRAELQRCEGCHKPPADRLHRAVKGYCHQCHTPPHWKPATFDHERFFTLDADHNVECSTCHESGEFRRYTCYGCHAHRPDEIRAKHLEEGIGNFEDCVRCHKSAVGEAEGAESRRRSERDD